MRRKLPLYLGIIAIILIGFFLFKGGKHKTAVKHNVIAGTREVLKTTSKNVDLRKYSVDFFMENSASMDGYVNGNTQFKDVLGQMIVSSHHLCKSTDFYFVNNEVFQINNSAIGFIQMLTPAYIKMGNVGTTDVNQIFRNILEKTNKNTISVLFSDCIYSVSDVNAQLDNAKNATTDAFLTALNKTPSLATIVLQFKSKFSGMYYDRNDHPMSCNQDRPFYVVITGDRVALRQMYSSFKISQLPGLQHKCFMSSESWTLDEDNACTIISDYTNARRIRTSRNSLIDIESINLTKDASDLEFAVGIDGDGIFADDEYMLDPMSYTIEPRSFKVISVEKASSAATGDFAQTPKCPYAVKVQVPTTGFAPKITLGLVKTVPSWAKKSNVADDAGFIPGPTQSFAIQKMIEGISNAYNADYSHTFKVEININEYNR